MTTITDKTVPNVYASFFNKKNKERMFFFSNNLRLVCSNSLD